MKTLNEIIGDYQKFLDDIFFMIEDIDLDVENLELDHLCFRVSSEEEYESKKNEFIHVGNLLMESLVNGRNISTYKLNNPIEYKNRKISLIELPAPKEGSHYSSGLEHIEFVTKEPLQKIVNRYPQFAFETFGINKKINPDITLKLGQYCLRFHNQSLEDVIRMEKNPRHKQNQTRSNRPNNQNNKNFKRPKNNGRPNHYKK